MLREKYEQIVSGIDVRKNLIDIKKELKQDSNRMALLYYM